MLVPHPFVFLARRSLDTEYSISAIGIVLSRIRSVGLCVWLSVSRSVWKVYCGKTADCIRIPLEVVSGVGQGMTVLGLHEMAIVEGEGQFWR